MCRCCNRDYGETASSKSPQLISDLISATLCVGAAVLVAMGWRPGVNCGYRRGNLITLLLRLVFSLGLGFFTLNRVSLFALKFSPSGFWWTNGIGDYRTSKHAASRTRAAH